MLQTNNPTQPVDAELATREPGHSGERILPLSLTFRRRPVLRTRAIVALLGLTFASFAASETQHYSGPMRFRTFWPCDGNGSMCGIRILAEGALESDTANRFAQFLANPASHEHPLPPVPIVVFDSPGGSIAGGMALGRMIRQRRMDTAVEAEYLHVETTVEGRAYPVLVAEPFCASACALAFAGGVNRSIGPGARLGVHQFSAKQGSIGDSTSQVTVVVLATYLEEMGTDRRLLDLASLTPATSIYWVSQEAARRVQIDNTKPLLAGWSLGSTPTGDGVLETTQSLSPARRVNLRIAVSGDLALMAVATLFEKALIGNDRLNQFPVGEQPRISICAGSRCIQGSALRPWVRTETQSGVSMQAVIAFSHSRTAEARTRNGPLHNRLLPATAV